MDVWPSPSQTTFRLHLNGDSTSPVPQDRAGDLILGFCGAMRDVRLQKVGDNADLVPRPLLQPSDTEIDSNRLGHLSDCRVIDVPKSDLTGISFGPAGASWALPPLEGETSAATEASNGAQHRYALPNIVSTYLPVDGVLIDPVANESMASLTPHELPGEFVPTVASPQLNDSGILEWNFPLTSAQGNAGHRITGTDQQEGGEIQQHLFFASGLSGVAGGALIWLFSTFGIFHKRVRRGALPTTSTADLLGPELTGRQASTTAAQPLTGTDQDEAASIQRKILVTSALSAVTGGALIWIFGTFRVFLKKGRR